MMSDDSDDATHIAMCDVFDCAKAEVYIVLSLVKGKCGLLHFWVQFELPIVALKFRSNNFDIMFPQGEEEDTQE